MLLLYPLSERDSSQFKWENLAEEIKVLPESPHVIKTIASCLHKGTLFIQSSDNQNYDSNLIGPSSFALDVLNAMLLNFHVANSTLFVSTIGQIIIIQCHAPMETLQYYVTLSAYNLKDETNEGSESLTIHLAQLSISS